jgi:hypothetical protein
MTQALFFICIKLALGIAETNDHGTCQSIAVGWKSTVLKSYTKDKSNNKLYVTILYMSFNEHCLVVFTTFINFVNSFRFDMNKLDFFALYAFLIIQVRFKFLLCEIEYRYFLMYWMYWVAQCLQTPFAVLPLVIIVFNFMQIRASTVYLDFKQYSLHGTRLVSSHKIPLKIN